MTTVDLKGLKICYFGHYDPRYARNQIIKKALQKARADIIEVNDRSTGFIRYRNLFNAAFRCQFDVMIVGFIGHTDIPLAKLICSLKKCPLIFDVFVSLYDSIVWDRQQVHPHSLTAKKLYYIDKIACQLADIVLLDTSANIHYFVQTFRLPEQKFFRLWVGADDDIMYYRSDVPNDSTFTVFFYGSFIPLHGIEYIIQAAKILEKKGDIRFVIVGSGQTFQKIYEMASRLVVSNVQFVDRVPYEQLPVLISQAHLCLGIFGTTAKAQRVIPNKVFDALAMGRPVITGDTPAIREAFTHGQDIWLVPVGNSETLAWAIHHLKEEKPKTKMLALNGYKKFKSCFSIEAITEQVVAIILKAIGQ